MFIAFIVRKYVTLQKIDIMHITENPDIIQKNLHS